MNINLWIKEVIEGNVRLAIPIMTHPGIEDIGASVKQAVCDGTVHFEAIKAVNNAYNPAATTVIMDLTVEAEAFGAEIVFPEDEIPSVVGRLLQDEEDIDKLNIPDLSKGRIPEYLKANKLVAESINDKPAFAGCIGPFSLAGRLFDMSEMMMLCYSEPEAAKKLLQKCTDFLLSYCTELKNTGADGVVVAEPAAGLLSNEGCEEFSSEYIKQIVDKLQDDYFLIILHNCGNTGHCTQAMLATGANAYHFGNKINMVEALNECPPDVLAMGNTDPVSIFKQATPDGVRYSVKTLLDDTKSFKNFIISSGCDTPPHVPKENIIAFYETVREFNNALNG